ncbi:MAG: class I SAM-dependent methyltransferase [Chloroflexi bacterium]|nr:class I SAM-dependent methyltransferase [Chloroflexota bacterium]
MDFELTLSRFLHSAVFSPSDRVLEVGCGPGVWLQQVAPMVREVVGLDVSSSMIAQAKTRDLGPNVTLVVSDFLAFGPETQFDKIYSIRSIEYFPRKEEFVAKAQGLLTHGGRLLVITKSTPSLWVGRTRLKHLVRRAQRRGDEASGGAGDSSLWQVDDHQFRQRRIGAFRLGRIMRAAGFKNIRYVPIIVRLPLFKGGEDEYPVIPGRLEGALLPTARAFARLSWKLPQPLRWAPYLMSNTYLIAADRP